MLPTAMVYLAADTPGERLLEGGGSELGKLFLLMVIGVSIFLFMKRAFTAFIGFALFAMVVSVFVFSPETITGMGEKGVKWIFGPWING